jgi:hypothetical protein
MRIWRWGTATPPQALESEDDAIPDGMALPTAHAILARFRLVLRNPSALVGREYLDRRVLLDPPAKIETALVTIARERATAGDLEALGPLREMVRRLAATVEPEVAAQLRAFHAKLPGGADASLSGITLRIQEALGSIDFLELASRQVSESRRLLSTFETSVASARFRRSG